VSITGLHIPYDSGRLAAVSVNERNATSYCPYVQSGPVEAAHLNIDGLELVVYVNSRYPAFEESVINPERPLCSSWRGLECSEARYEGCAGRAFRGSRGLRAVAAT
jgi:hypothetical protein